MAQEMTFLKITHQTSHRNAKRYQRQLICVRESCEAEVDQMVLKLPLSLNPVSYTSMDKVPSTCNPRAHKLSSKSPKLHKGDILLTGHTHIPAWEGI